ARRNVLAMRAVQPAGPYAIGGYSLGVLVAFEMACQLRAVGEDVALLVVLDTAAPIGARSVMRRVHARADALRCDVPEGSRRATAIAARAVRFGLESVYAHA